MTGQKKYGQQARPQWPEVRPRLHMRIKDAAAELKVTIAYLRRLCHENGYPQWPGKQVRYMNGIGKTLMLEAEARHGSPWAGLAGSSSSSRLVPKIIAETLKKKEVGNMTRNQAPVANHPPRQELTTLNLIDKVGSSSTDSKSN